MEITQTKHDLRLKAKEIRSQLPTDEISYRLCEKVRSNDLYKNANNVMIYYPIEKEINFLLLMEDNKNFYLPKVRGKDLLVCPYRIGDTLVKSFFDIPEPVSAPVDPKILDIVIVPALMADKDGYRLGYGKGFYDRFLEFYKSDFKTLAAVPELLLCDKLPVNSYDEPVDIVLVSN